MNMKTKAIISASAVLIVLAICGYAWQRYILHPEPQACGYCLRPLHANLRVTAEIDGKRAEVCCAHCAITEANQQHKALKLITVRDYPTGAEVKPENAWFVEGSRVTACEHDAAHMNEMKETQDLAFDRCSPGTFAFANRATANAFVDQNGGSVLSFQELMREVHVQ
jgi:hypothetical protein